MNALFSLAGIPQRIDLIKTVSCGNDFLQLDLESLSEKRRSRLGQFAHAICDRHNGMGADGLVARCSISSGTFGFQVFNRDGREAELSGNGMAGCAAVVFALEPGLNSITLQTAVGPRRIACKQRRFPRVDMSVEIGPADFANYRQFPFLDKRAGGYASDGIDFFPVSVGNPHAVCLVPSGISEKEMVELGQHLQSSTRFPEGINVEVVRPGNTPGHWHARFIERGVGITQSSSTGCAAIFAVLHKQRLAAQKTVIFSAGASGIHVGGNLDGITVENTTQIVYKGEYAPLSQEN
ncbi:MAG TPA: diaminopimelate epimerase [Candidatus Aminicenantes bacterium]|nr:diaminopimelate epimerase [Candidatus Aminicenantes bacterium]